MDDSYMRKDTNRPIITSPYLNFDPSILNPGGSQFIIPEGQGEYRGKMEMAFFKIGVSVGAGGLFGGVNGLYHGLKETSNLSGPIKRTQILNSIAKHGAVTSQSLAAIALMYSLYDTMFYYSRGVDDELNMLGAAAVTGLTYTSTQGYKKAIRGGLVGIGIMSAYLAYTNSNSLNAFLTSLKS